MNTLTIFVQKTNGYETHTFTDFEQLCTYYRQFGTPDGEVMVNADRLRGKVLGCYNNQELPTDYTPKVTREQAERQRELFEQQYPKHYDDQRAQAAVEIAAKGLMVEVDTENHKFLVGGSKGKIYTTTPQACTCADSVYRGNRCKHRLAVAFTLQMLSERETVPAQRVMTPALTPERLREIRRERIERKTAKIIDPPPKKGLYAKMFK